MEEQPFRFLTREEFGRLDAMAKSQYLDRALKHLHKVTSELAELALQHRDENKPKE
ncbi:MAG: hypothetical protein QOD26_244 [Betaproteobacteria bacterium]|jgi:hypothetical protein|nr:hypothetical protein [Betaproteobacteria bacterium]